MGQEGGAAELRQYPRVRMRTPFPCAFFYSGWYGGPEGNREGLGVVFDISRRGAKVLSETVPLVGDEVTASLRLPSQISSTVIQVARVRWRKAQEFGLEFTALSKTAEMCLHGLMAQSLNDRTEAMRELAHQFVVDNGPAIFGALYLDRKKLDYGCDSLRHVDSFLAQVRQSHGMEEAWADVVLRVGAYVGEVIRRNSTHHAWYWIDFDSAKALDPTACADLGGDVGVSAILFSGSREFALPLLQVDRRLRRTCENDLLSFAESMMNWK